MAGGLVGERVGVGGSKEHSSSRWRRLLRLLGLLFALLLLAQYLAGSSVASRLSPDLALARLATLFVSSTTVRPTPPVAPGTRPAAALPPAELASTSPPTPAAVLNDTAPPPALNATGAVASEEGQPPELTEGPTTPSPPSTFPSDRLLPQPSGLPDCPVIPPVLVGPIKVWFDYPAWAELEALYSWLEPGGHGKPAECLARHRVAVVVPYRDRDTHLRGFLHNLHSLLTKQQLDYAVVVVEQISGQTFNRGKLMNVGFVEALKIYNFQCVIFHDVDLFPEDDRNLYTCPEQPRHMSVAVDKFSYKLPYADIFGGISALRTEHFARINGMSNDFWGWGGEDDDIATRVKAEGFRIQRYPAHIARYKMIKHVNEKSNPVNKCRFNLIYATKKRYKHDGLNTLAYEVRSRTLRHLYTHLLVDLKEAEGRAALDKEGVCHG